MSSAAATPLSDVELTELDEFLFSDACDDETLTVEEAHGLMTASLVGPEPFEREELLTLIWGSPRFADAAQKERKTSLLLRLEAEIDVVLREGRIFEPMVVEEEEDGVELETYEGWCFGFMLGVEQRQDHWEGLPKDQQALLAPMAQLALLVSEEEPDMDEEQYDAWVELLPGAVTGLYQFWHG